MLASYPVYKLGIVRELYPFFYWRLYSEPIGWEGASTHRLYARSEGDPTWTRVPFRPLPGYASNNWYSLQWGDVVNKALADTLRETDAYANLLRFARTAAPDAEEFRLVEESFQPLALLKDPTDYDTTTVAQFAR